MTIASVIRDALQDMSAVTALTSTIRTLQLDQRDKPYESPCLLIDIVSIDTDEGTDLSGRTDLALARIEVIAMASSLTDAWALTEAVRTNGTSPGTGLQGLTNNSPYFVSILKSRDADYFVYDDGSDAIVNLVASTYDVLYRETQ